MKIKYLVFSLLMLLSSSFVQAEMTLLDNAITWAYTKKFTSSFSTDEFKPYQAIRRDEAAKFFVLFAKLVGKTQEVIPSSQCQFSDLNKARTDLKGVVVESCTLGIFKGNKEKFTPDGMLTNAQAVTVLMRIVDGYQIESGKSRRDNYYKKANELKLLDNLQMNEANDMAERGDVVTLLYNARKLTGVNEEPPVDTSIFHQKLITTTTGTLERIYPYAQSYNGGYIGFGIGTGNSEVYFIFMKDKSIVSTGVIPLKYDFGDTNKSITEHENDKAPISLKTLTCNDKILGYNAKSGLYDALGGIKDTVTTREDNCLAQAFKYIYNVLNGKEKSTSVQTALQSFKQSIDNKK